MESDESLIAVTSPGAGVTCLRLDRYSRRNALNWQMWRELDLAIASVRDDDDCRVMILTGTNDVFSAGADLRSPGESGRGITAKAARLNFAGDVLREIRELRKPTIAAVDGFAIGIGWSLALACSVVLAGANARFRCAFLENGLVPDGGILWSLVNTLGTPRAAELLYSDRYVGADEAAKLGLISRESRSRPALDEAVELASKLAEASRDAVELSTELLRAANSLSHDEYVRTEWVTAALNFQSEQAFSAVG